MYYSYINNFRGKTHRFIAIPFLFILFFVVIFHTTSFAVVDFDEQAAEYRSLAHDAQQDGDFDRALTFYSKAVAVGKGDAWVYNNVGVIYEQMGLVDKAELSYLKALEIDSDYLPVYTNLAYLYKEKGDIPRAISYFRTRIDAALEGDEWVPLLIEEITTLDPKYREDMVFTQLEETGQRLYQIEQEELSLSVARADGHYRKAKELLGQHNFIEAIMEVDKALALTPESPKLQKVREKIIIDQRLFEVKKKAEEAMEFLNSGDMNSARREFQSLLTILPSETVQE